MGRIITEITPLSEKDCFYLVDRRKRGFDYPIHRHDELELNFITNCKGAKRIAGDSIEEIPENDLALMGRGLEHTWENGNRDPKLNDDMREITIQFSDSLITQNLLQRNQLGSLRTLFDRATKGIAFHQPVIDKITPLLEAMTTEQPGFIRLLKLLEVLYYLSVTQHYHLLSTSSFSNATSNSDSRRIKRIEEYIAQNYTRTIYLAEVAEIAGMAPTAFSRFFKMRTGRTLSDYIVETRIGHAARRLVDTSMSSAEICYECGFNNLSNFNRLFKKKKGCSPTSFRAQYLKTKIII